MARDFARLPSSRRWRTVAALLASIAAGPAVADLHGANASSTKGALDDIHGMVRSGVVTGDFGGMPPQDAASGPEFGFSVAISGDWLVVGAPGTVVAHASGDFAAGAVFVFRRIGAEWVQQQRILRPADSDAHCGYSVALSLPHLVFGCPDGINSLGREAGWVYKYRLEDDRFVLKSSRSHDTDDAHCGRALALTRNYLATSCPTAGEHGNGRVYVTRRSAAEDVYAGEIEAQIGGGLAQDVEAFAFGQALAMHEPAILAPGLRNVRLAIGAPSSVYDGSIFPRGSVHVYHRDTDAPTWSERATFLPATSGTDDATLAEFGAAVAINASQLVVGAPNNRFGAIDTLPGPGNVHRYALVNTVGSVYQWQVRENGGGINLPDGPHAGMRYGAAVALAQDNLAVIGAPGTDGEENDGDSADAVGLVEFRRTAGGDWSVSNYAGAVRPGPINPLLTLDEGHFGRSLDSDVGHRRVAVGYPGSGSSLSGPGGQGGRRGAVWIYASSDGTFEDGFED